jgi:high-affinity nickel-transport protein
MDLSILAAVSVGFGLGLRHALDADHLAAVAVIVSGRRRSLAGASLVGMSWGAGHAAALSTIGIAVVLMGFHVPARLASLMEAAAGAALVIMGGRLLFSLRRGALLHAHVHVHGGRLHFHPHLHPHEAIQREGGHHALPARFRSPLARARCADSSFSGPPMSPFLFGLLHGTAGSAPLMLAILSALPGRGARLAYVALFGLGSIAGMTCVSALVGIPFRFGGPLEERTRAGLRLAAGGISVALGLTILSRFASL